MAQSKPGWPVIECDVKGCRHRAGVFVLRVTETDDLAERAEVTVFFECPEHEMGGGLPVGLHEIATAPDMAVVLRRIRGKRWGEPAVEALVMRLANLIEPHNHPEPNWRER